MQALVRSITVLVLILSLGLQWALLQTVAWTGMIISYSRDASLTEAISKTFDGQHPCPLCKVIKQGRAAEKKQEKEAPINKLTLAVIWQRPIYCFDSEREPFRALDEFFPQRRNSPPKPCPRGGSFSHSLKA